MKNLLVSVLLLACPGVMAANADPAPATPAMVGGNGESLTCTSTAIVKSADGVGGIHVRTGPTDEDLIFGFLPDGESVWVCGHEGSWVGVVYSNPKGGSCETDSPLNPKQPRGTCHSGWVRESDIKQAAE